MKYRSRLYNVSFLVIILTIIGCEYTIGVNDEVDKIKPFNELNIDNSFTYNLSNLQDVINEEGITSVYTYTGNDTTYVGKMSSNSSNRIQLESASKGFYFEVSPNSNILSKSVANNGKITICHIPPGNPQNTNTLSISESAWPAHRDNHGDTFGACEGDSFEDSDGDGVVDYIDDYPNDSLFAFTSYYPGIDEMGTLLFEDMWPMKGDYDFNDLVVYYKLTYKKNADNKIVGIDYTYNVAAIGGVKNTSFFIRLLDNNMDPFPYAVIENVSGNDITYGFANVRTNGTEVGTEEAVIPVIDNTRNAFDGVASGEIINVIDEDPVFESDTLTISILFNRPYNENEVYFDPFIVTDFNREVEIHLPVFGPTEKARNSNYFGTEDDQTNLDNQFYYKNSENYPWALNIPREIVYPKENSDFSSTYIEFSEWAESSGNSRKNWYVQENGKYHTHKVYKKRKK